MIANITRVQTLLLVFADACMNALHAFVDTSVNVDNVDMSANAHRRICESVCRLLLSVCSGHVHGHIHGHVCIKLWTNTMKFTVIRVIDEMSEPSCRIRFV